MRGKWILQHKKDFYFDWQKLLWCQNISKFLLWIFQFWTIFCYVFEVGDFIYNFFQYVNIINVMFYYIFLLITEKLHINNFLSYARKLLFLTKIVHEKWFIYNWLADVHIYKILFVFVNWSPSTILWLSLFFCLFPLCLLLDGFKSSFPRNISKPINK